MKKVLAVLLAFSLAISVPVCSSADIDLSPLYSEYYEINVDREDECAYVTSSLTARDRSFAHKNENEFLYSTTQFDIIILNYFDDSYPVFRLWINYTADEFVNATGATIEFGGKKYAFSGIGSKEHQYELDNGISESLCIIFGMENLDFLIDLSAYAGEILDEDDINAVKTDAKLTLSGSERITADLDVAFLLDFYIMLSGFTEIGGIDSLYKAVSSPMKITAC